MESVMRQNQNFNKIHFLLIVILLTFPILTHAQILNFRIFGADEGLLQSQVYTILQDNDGYLWFGTVNGISIYDGHHFKTITRKDGLAENHIISGLKDRAGNLWFGHKAGVISKYDWHTKTFKIIYLYPKDKTSKSIDIKDIFEDSSGQIWVATDGSGVFYLQNDSLINFNSQLGLKPKRFFAVSQDNKQNIWLGSDSSIFIYSLKTKSLKKFSIAKEKWWFSYRALCNDGRGNMWLGTYENGLFKYNLKTKKRKHYTPDQGLSGYGVSSIFADGRGKIWVSGELSGASYATIENIKEETFRPLTTKNGLPFDGVNTIARDREGNYWFGTSGRGAAQLRDRRFELWSPGVSDKEKSMWSIYIDEQGVKWFGTGGGLIAVDKQGKVVHDLKEFHGVRLNDILQITEDTNKHIWFISNTQGCFEYNKISKKLKPFLLPKPIRDYLITSVEEDKAGNLLLGGLALGLVHYNLHTRKIKPFSVGKGGIPLKSVNILYQDSHKNVWVGMLNGGLLKWNGHNLIPIPGAPNTVVSLAEGPMHDLWILNDKDRLFRYADNKIEQFDVTGHGLEGLAIFSVNADSKSIWLGTTSGLARLGYGDSLFTFYTKKAGYPVSETNENAVYKDKEGNLWFGSINGMICYHPNQEVVNSVAPFVHIQGIKLFLKDIPLVAGTQFNPADNYLSFEFVGISFTAPEGVRYRYRLKGLDKDWLPETAHTSATYSNLPPGKYIFQVKAHNNDGVWNALPAEFSFEILTPFWHTWWFITIILLILILVVYTYVYWRTNTMKRINRMLEDRVQERTKELQSEKEAVEKTLLALKESENKFRTYTELTSSAIYIHQGDHFRFVNKAGELISGYSKDELMQMNIWELVHPSYKRIMQKRFQSRMQGENALSRYEFKILTKDQRERWLDFTGQMILYDDKPALLATVFDITERKDAEAAVLAEKERLMVTLRSIGDGVITTDVQGIITLMNDRAKEILDCDAECIVGSKLSKILYLFDERTGVKKTKIIEQVLSGTGTDFEESNLVVNTMANRQKYISLVGSPLRDKHSQIIGAVMVLRDVTEKRQMEQELIKGQKLESVGVLAGGIAHDFNNILTAIIGNLSLAKLQLDPADAVLHRIENAEKASARAQDLTQQLLTFSKGGAPVKQLASIEEIIRDSVGFILSGSNVKPRLEFGENIPAVEVDSGQISQVIQNLIINADQAMPNGGNIHIKVKALNISATSVLHLQPGNYVRIDIADEGIGISPEYLDKIFDPFFTTKQSGSGLGLATSYSILQKHGGLIKVQSDLGEGTTFSLFLPASADSSVRTDNETIDIKNFHGHGRILVMDDESLIHETIKDMLNNLGYELTLTRDGSEALDAYQKALKENNKFHVVIMDLTIPGGMGGKETIQKLLQIDASATAIVSSGYSSDPVMSNFTEYGFKACLRKPYRVEEIISVLEKLHLGTRK